MLSNHGGRQVDIGQRAARAAARGGGAVGDRVEVYVDGGDHESGPTSSPPLAFGARATLVGRAYLYGLMAGGEQGVARVVEILEKEISSTLALLGVPKVSDLHGPYVRLRPSLQ